MWVICLLCTGIRAETHDIPPLAVLSGYGSSYSAMLSALQSAYNGELTSAPLDGFSAAHLNRLVIGVGTQACQKVLANATTQTQLLCVLIPSTTFATLTQGERPQQMLKQHRLSAIYLDQPLERQMRLALAMKPDMRTLGTALGKDSGNMESRFRQTAEALNLVPIVTHLTPNDNPVKMLTPVLERSDLFLALPDSSVFNRASAKWILYISLRLGVPLIGFSTQYADAGAVAALYSSSEDIARQASAIIKAGAAGVSLPAPGFPRYFSISVNQTAASNLNLPALDSSWLLLQLQKQEQP